MKIEILNGLALCSGIGGFELGISRALGGQLRSVCFVEREAYAASTLVARMEGEALDRAPIYDDLKSFDGAAWRGKVDLISAGYPCQPFSAAGKRGGENDPRHLWPDVARIIREVGPRFVCLENVRGHLSLGFERVLGQLADLGFDAEWITVQAAEVGAPHKRERLFVLGYANHDGIEEYGGPQPHQRWAGFNNGRHAVPHAGRHALWQEQGRAESGRPREAEPRNLGEAVADPLRFRCGERPRAQPRSFPAAWPPGPTGGWTGIAPELHPSIERDLRGVADGIPEGLVYRTDRLRCLGNAVVPAQAERAFRGLFARIAQ